ncbi:radical SAM family RiPP maturation amino acid epimerase [Nostoc sp. UHCC 0870]|nr:radical SAM family RiPP maturation amino acid epimerase [Nostoc sp. UHCC 0870]
MQTQELNHQVEAELISPPFDITEYYIDNHAIFTTIDQIDQKLLAKFSQVKRFKELWQMDVQFRQQVSTHPHHAFVRHGLKLHPEDVRPIWDEDCNSKWEQGILEFPLLKMSNEFFARLDYITNLHLKTAPNNIYIQQWRERQIARTASQFQPLVNQIVVHAPVSFELCKGCSVGCRFCGVSAPPLTEIFFYTPENAKLWREVLEVMTGFLGTAAGNGFCYWATDPLDNPDYEKFCLDFHAITGFFPQTTTSQPLKYPDRLRSILKLSRERNGICNRFSILSLKMFEKVHTEFSAEELLKVQLLYLNDEAENAHKAHAGRQREANLQKSQGDEEPHVQGTIACVSGFLFNMVERSVKLISPCNANERWPLGYIVYDQGTFVDADDLKSLIERMIRDNMPQTVRLGDVLRFRPDLKYEALVDGFQLSTHVKTFKFRHDSLWKQLGVLIHQGNHTTAEITQFFTNKGVLSTQTSYYLNLLFERGVLDSEPQI